MLETREMWKCDSTEENSWEYHRKSMFNEKVLRNKNGVILGIRNRQLEFLGHIMEKEDLENLTPTGYTEVKRQTSSNLPKEFGENLCHTKCWEVF